MVSFVNIPLSVDRQNNAAAIAQVGVCASQRQCLLWLLVLRPSGVKRYLRHKHDGASDNLLN